nr:lysylphosphatidylglycerol synthase transmembrane domain-containing protein [Larsenimonas salina]
MRVTLLIGVIAIMFATLDFSHIYHTLSSPSAGWLAAGLALTVPQFLLSAWRWQLTAHALKLSLPFSVALKEYYLATVLNQILPGGIGGDITRAWRHSQDSDQKARAIHAVIIERLSGQLALLTIGLITLIAHPILLAPFDRLLHLPGIIIAPLAGSAVIIAAGLVWHFRTAAGHFLNNVRLSLLTREVWLQQLASSLIIVGTYIGVFACCARALDSPLDNATLMALIPPILMAMVVPLSVGGWGVRESAAAVVWGIAGFSSSEGVAISILYGTLVLVSSLPGAVIFLMRRRSQRTSSNARSNKTSLPRANVRE